MDRTKGFLAAAPGDEGADATRLFAFVGERVWIRDGAEGAALFPAASELPDAQERLAVGAAAGERWAVVELASPPAAPGTRTASLRGLLPFLEPELARALGTASQLATWRRTHRHCGACGGPTAPSAGERARVCAACDLRFYPRVSPCVIVLVTDGDAALLTRKRGFPAGMYGLVAGFVEPGETLEECAAREVLEETGIEIGEPRYFGSQPWPFPHQLMVGYVAERTGGELRVDTSELEDARFFPRSGLPLLPPPFSIARALLDRWLGA